MKSGGGAGEGANGGAAEEGAKGGARDLALIC
jgi:hypothetical protein